MTTQLEVRHLTTMRISTAGVASVPLMGAPQGSRAVATVTGGTFEGERLTGTLPEGVAAGDWITLRPDRTIKLDVRAVLRTHDGADILVTYTGIGRPADDGFYEIRTAPLFETGDERYAWLNALQAVGIGRNHDGGVTYEVYELL
jgi:Protein of unknown function (DUF3237)